MKSVAPKPVAIAVGAHPDDIEFGMAGTLLLLRDRGWETHYFNVASGSCGSRQYPATKLRLLRRREAKQAAALLGATWHASLVDDLEVFYDLKTLRKVAAVLRQVKPSLVLTHSPDDYMEDHENTCRLVVTAAFSLGMPNFRTSPVRRPVDQAVTVYHAMPHGLADGMRRRVIPGSFVNTASVHARKLKALAAHRTQQDWLDHSQGMNSYLRAMDEQSRRIGELSGKFMHAEGWRRHSHLGFSPEGHDPLQQTLDAVYRLNAAYERALRPRC
jgi:LmbE family N-acetylglucosaminyl deacetylase